MMIRTLVASLAASTCMIAPAVAAQAQTQAVQARAFNIPAGPFKAALDAYARQSGRQIIYKADDVRSARSRGARGSMSAEAALQALLAGTGFSARVDSSGAIAIVRGAGAQAEPSGAEQLAGDATAGDAQAVGSDAGQDDEVIVVTAQKRVESVQDVPISISVVAGESLVEAGASQLTDFAGYIPGFAVTNNGSPGQANVAVRGISSLSESATVGVYVDDAPVGSSTSYNGASNLTLDLMPYDIQRIELLRGPQGTLYGASSIGGLLKYVTVAPDLDRFSVRGGGEIFTLAHASDLGFAAQARVNVPLIPGTLAATASIAYRKTPGWIDNFVTGAKDQNPYDQLGGRVSLLWQPNSDFSIRLSGLWQSIDADNRTLIAEDATGLPVGNGRSNNNTVPETFSYDIQYYVASLSYDFGFATLSSTSTYSDVKSRRVMQLDGGGAAPLPDPATAFGVAVIHTFPLEKFTQEVRLTSPSGGAFEWLVGGFYTHEESRQNQLVNIFVGGAVQPGDLAIVQLPADYDEYALFGNATLRLNDRLDITAGLRWAHNEQTNGQSVVGPLFGLPTPLTSEGASSDSVVTYSVSPQFHVNEDAMLYARVASGYRSGGPNVFVPGSTLPGSFQPDTITNYELGFKGSFADRKVQVDVAAFRMDWEDIQLFLFIPPFFNGLGNGGTARSQGIEGSLTLRPTRGLSFTLNGAYTDAKLTEDAPAGNAGLDGDRLPGIPKFSGSVQADYSFSFAENAVVQLGGGLRYTGTRLSTVESDARVRTMEDYALVDARASVTFDDRYTVRLYARNLLDSGAPVSRSADPAVPFLTDLIPVQPRTIGLALDVSF